MGLPALGAFQQDPQQGILGRHRAGPHPVLVAETAGDEVAVEGRQFGRRTGPAEDLGLGRRPRSGSRRRFVFAVDARQLDHRHPGPASQVDHRR